MGDIQNISDVRIICTSWYRPPEISLYSIYDPKCDIWAWGCILYEALTGKVAMDGCSIRSNFVPTVSVYQKNFCLEADIRDRTKFWFDKLEQARMGHKHRQMLAELLAASLDPSPKSRASASELLDNRMFSSVSFCNRRQHYLSHEKVPWVSCPTIQKPDKKFAGLVFKALTLDNWPTDNLALCLSLAFDLSRRIKTSPLSAIDVLACLLTADMYYNNVDSFDKKYALIVLLVDNPQLSVNENAKILSTVFHQTVDRIKYLIDYDWQGKIFSNHLVNQIGLANGRLPTSRSWWSEWWTILVNQIGPRPMTERQIFELLQKINTIPSNISDLSI